MIESETLTSCIKVPVTLAVCNEDTNLILDVLNAGAKREVTETTATAVDAQTNDCGG